MDKVQIYETVMIIVWFILMGIEIGMVADNSKKVGIAILKLVLGILLSLPVAGRIFGWW